MQNWLTQKPHGNAFDVMLLMTFLLLFSGLLFLNNYFDTTLWMPANPRAVFDKLQIWRLWTALFAHADLGHLMNNSLLFIPLAYLLTGYFGIIVFPLLGLFIGGLINLIVLFNMPPENSLIGMSGVVYWMGAIWLTLFALIDNRKSIRLRFAIVLFLTVLLFAPHTYKPEISYLSHLLGYIFGVFNGVFYYLFKRKKFLAAEVREEILDDSEVLKSEQDDVQLPRPEISKV